ncbi:MAG: twin-arginine translocase subunit TatC, partial [Asticcacaulis sp.]|nr:twin-arginine translocase subunit TatC [Asticcacaulis sp.]
MDHLIELRQRIIKCVFAFVVSFPILAYQLYRFVAPGLYRRERMAFLPFLVAAPVLFAMGMALVYYLI